MKVTGAERPRGSGATCICSDLLGTTSLTSVRPQKRLSRGANAGGATTDLSTGKLCGSRSSHRLSDRAPQLRSRQPEHTSGPAPHPSLSMAPQRTAGSVGTHGLKETLLSFSHCFGCLARRGPWCWNELKPRHRIGNFVRLCFMIMQSKTVGPTRTTREESLWSLGSLFWRNNNNNNKAALKGRASLVVATAFS